MDFEKVLRKLLEEFEGNGIRHALMGGFALGALGVSRATMDLDFLVHRQDLERLQQTMAQLGYERHFASENVSQYRNRDAAWGSVDFVHAFRQISLAMLGRSVEKPVFGGARTVRVLQPEDVIGLKVQAMVNDSRRKSMERADIEALMGLYRERLDWERLREYYQLFRLDRELEELRAVYGHAE